MSIIYLIIFILVVSCFAINFKRTLIIYAPFKFILHNTICLYDSGQYISLDLAICIMALFIFISKYHLKLIKEPKYLTFACSLYCLSTFIFGCNPRLALNILLYEPITAIAYFLMLSSLIESKKDLLLLIKSSCIVSLILCLDAFIDYTINFNPIIYIEKTQAREHFWYSANDVARAGMSRTTSFMPHSIAMGTLAALLFGIFSILYIQFDIIRNKKLVLLNLICLPLVVILSNSRTPIITILCFIPLLLSPRVSKKTRLLFFTIIGIAFFAFKDYFMWMYNSIFNEDKVEVAGSTTTLRESQWEIALYYFLNNPLLGMGNEFIIGNFENEKDVMGMESVWFPLLYQQGLVGLVGYISFILAGLISVLKSNWMFITYVIAWIAAITFSSQVGISIFLFAFGILISNKSYLLKNTH